MMVELERALRVCDDNINCGSFPESYRVVREKLASGTTAVTPKDIRMMLAGAKILHEDVCDATEAICFELGIK